LSGGVTQQNYVPSYAAGNWFVWLGSSVSTLSLAQGMVGASSAVAGVSGTVPAPLAGQQNFGLQGDGTWGTGAINLTAGTLSAVIGGVTFSITNADPMFLTTSLAMTGFVTSEVFQVAVGGVYDFWRAAGSGLASAGSTLIRGGSWNGVTNRNIGLSSSSYCCVVQGYLVGNGRTFRISGGSTNGSPNVIIEVVG
jgi:hypothetical protein